MLKLSTLNRCLQTGAQQVIFQDSGSSVELGHFDNHFVKSSKNAPQVKILVLFFQILLKLHYLNWKFNPKIDQIMVFFFSTIKKDIFLNFQNRAGESSTHSAPHLPAWQTSISELFFNQFLSF